MESLNQSILSFFVGVRTDWLNFTVMVITYAGSYMIIIGLTVLSGISFFIHKHYARILPLLIVVGGSAATTYTLKHFFYEARPLAALYFESGSSFPSGHATAAMALYGFLLFTIWKHDNHCLKKGFIFFLIILIALVGMSRLYLGVHYLTDVLAGYTIGLIWLFAGAKLHEYLLHREQHKLNNL